MPQEFKRQNQLIIAKQKDLDTIGDKIGDLIAEQNKLDDQVKLIRTSLTDAMAKFGITKWVTPNGTQISFIGESSSTKEKWVFNEEKFKKENIDLYKQYLENVKETSSRTPHVRIIIPKEK